MVIYVYIAVIYLTIAAAWLQSNINVLLTLTIVMRINVTRIVKEDTSFYYSKMRIQTLQNSKLRLV